MADGYLLVSGDFVKTGGMDRANYALASYLARQGRPVDLVAHRVDDELMRSTSVAFHRVPKPLGSYWLGEPLLDRTGRHWAARVAGQGGRVVVNGGNCRWGDVNWVHYVHAAWSPAPTGSAARRVKAWLSRRASLAAERAALKEARVVIANSNRTARLVIERLDVPAERVHTLYYGIDPEQFRPPSDADRAEARARLGWTDDRPAVAVVGALGDTRKGFDTLFSAWTRLARDSGWDARLVVVGAGAALDGWRRAAHDAHLNGSIAFLGFRGDVPELLRACDALVSPTRYEAYGLNVHEALCTGLPALVSQSAGVAERYPESLAGLLLPDPDDANDLADRLRRWRDHARAIRAELMSFSDRLRAESWDDMAARFVAIVESSS